MGHPCLRGEGRSIVGGGGGAPEGEEFDVAFGAEEGGGGAVHPFQAELAGAEGADLFDDAFADGGVADDAFGGVFAAGFELGLDEGDQEAAGGEAGGHRREDELQGDEGDVGAAELGDLGEVGGGEVAAVELLFAPHAGVGAEAVVQLVGADVEGEDAPGAVLQEAVGEAARGGADVEAAEVGDVEPEGVKGALEFLAAAADEAGFGEEGELGAFGDGLAGLEGLLAVEEDFAGEDEALGRLAGVDEAGLDKGLVETLAHQRRRYCGVAGDCWRRASAAPRPTSEEKPPRRAPSPPRLSGGA